MLWPTTETQESCDAVIAPFMCSTPIGYQGIF